MSDGELICAYRHGIWCYWFLADEYGGGPSHGRYFFKRQARKAGEEAMRDEDSARDERIERLITTASHQILRSHKSSAARY